MIGGLARVLGMPAMAAIVEAIQEEVPSKPKLNIKASEEAYNQVELLEAFDDNYIKNSEMPGRKS